MDANIFQFIMDKEISIEGYPDKIIISCFDQNNELQEVECDRSEDLYRKIQECYWVNIAEARKNKHDKHKNKRRKNRQKCLVQR